MNAFATAGSIAHAESGLPPTPDILRRRSESTRWANSARYPLFTLTIERGTVFIELPTGGRAESLIDFSGSVIASGWRY